MFLSPAQADANTCYVKTDGGDTNGGASWGEAFATLQKALSVAPGSCDQIWIAEGIYYPDEGPGQIADDRNSTFLLKNGVAIYGGFAGTETVVSARNISAHPTILSGDIDKNDTNYDGNHIAETWNDINKNQSTNAYHVVTGNNITNSAVLDGFFITAGLADGTGSGPYPDIYYGGGIYNKDNSSPTLNNLKLSGNQGGWGGGVRNESLSNPFLTNITFSGNRASYGGGIYNDSSNPTLTNVTFNGNTTYNHGGGMYNSGSNPTLSVVAKIFIKYPHMFRAQIVWD
jgi:predicted outer membrane repeat protein